MHGGWPGRLRARERQTLRDVPASGRDGAPSPRGALPPRVLAAERSAGAERSSAWPSRQLQDSLNRPTQPLEFGALGRQPFLAGRGQGVVAGASIVVRYAPLAPHPAL